MDPQGDESGISHTAMQVYTWVVIAVLCQVINIFGIVTNTINIICFTKQGFEDSVNISLLALAVSDLGSLLTMAWACLSVTPTFSAADLPFEPADVMYLTSAMPHVSFTRVSSCITAMITLERCLCITDPLKIKDLITPKRTAVITVCLFMMFFFSGTPVYAVNELGMTFSSLRNKTMIIMISTKDRVNVEMISFAINNLLIPFGAFFIIVICTLILSIKLKNQSKWRQSITGSQDDRISSRNQKAAKMVVMISTLFIVCFIPVNVNTLAAGLIPDLLIHGKYYNISVVVSGFGFVLESINFSINIFIYFHMSSAYRKAMMKIFERLVCPE